jgi:hypothetical protein
MSNLYFVLWTCLWPVACAAEGYLAAKRRALTGAEEPGAIAQLIAAMIQLIVWGGLPLTLSIYEGRALKLKCSFTSESSTEIQKLKVCTSALLLYMHCWQ